MGKKKAKSQSVARHEKAVLANTVSAGFSDSLKQLDDKLRSAEYGRPWVLPWLDRLGKGQLPGLPPYGEAAMQSVLKVSPDEYAATIMDMHTAAVGRMWSSWGRVTYDLHQGLAAELHRSTSDQIPGSIFEHLPHINPLVVLPEPWIITDGLVRGFYVYGLRQDPVRSMLWPCLTNDSECVALGMMFVIDLVDKSTGEVTQQIHVTTRIPNFESVFTLEDVVRASMADEYQRAAQEAVDKQFKALMRPALSILVYLTCDNRDLAEPQVLPQQRQGHPGKRRQDRLPFFVEVGYRIGPGLHGDRRSVGRVSPGESMPSGVEHAPHQKSGHFRRVRFGPRRSLVTTRWIAPYWVRLDLLPEGEEPINTVVAVDSQRHDPLRRRGLKK